MARKPVAPAADTPPAAVNRTDLWVLAGLPALAALAWVAPQPAWPRICGVFSGLAVRVQGRSPAWLEAQIARTLGDRRTALSAGEIMSTSMACQIESDLLMLREYRPGGLRPAITLDGLGNLTGALERGRGAVLWIDYFAFVNLLAKMALHAAGHPLHHLAHPRHGYSESRFGMRWLNPITARLENRYLAERVTLSLSGAARALRTLQARLEAGRPVSLSARPTGSQVIEAPFLAGRLPLASGAPALAHSAGCALLPLSVVRTAEGRYTATIEPALPLDPAAPRKAAVAEAARAYAARLEAVVLQYPEQWLGWKMVLGPEG